MYIQDNEIKLKENKEKKLESKYVHEEVRDRWEKIPK